MGEINCKIPKIPDDPDPIELTVKNGFQLFIVGPNGSGKSALIQRFVSDNTRKKITRITAYRQTWFDSGSIDVTSASRQQYDRDTRNYDIRDEARWKDLRGGGGLSVVLFDLVAKENAINKSIARHVRNQDANQALEFADGSPSPFNRINELLDRGRLTVTIENSEDQDLLARHPQGEPFSIAEMSDGERNAMIIAAHVITAEPGTLFVIDEPERHLHRSIIQPFLSALFAERREDCAFIIATHEIVLPVANPEARVLMLRSCQWRDRECVAWDVQVLEPNSELPEDLKLAILGSRKIILFVEGKPSSKDFSLYTALFPSISVVPKGSCEEVQKAVFGLRESADLHRVEAFGLIDRDNMRSVFEAVVNAVVHRDYSKAGSKIRLFMFTDRLELYSPGALANTLTVDDLPYNQATRNELLARLLSETTLDDNMGRQVARRHFLERRGEGVGIILNESQALSGKTPLYELFGEELRLTIFAAKSLQDSDET